MLRILVILGALVLLAVPFLPIRLPITLCGYNFPEKQRPKNVIYLAGTVVVMLLVVILMPHVLDLADWFAGLKLVKDIIHAFSSYTRYGYQLFKVIFANILFDILVLAVHAFCGGLAGLYAKEDRKGILQRLRDALREWNAQRKRRRAEKKARKQPQEPQPEKAEEMPEKLLPKPEKKDYSGKVLIRGDKDQKPARKAAARSGASDASWDESLSFLVKLFYVKQGDEWYVQPQCKKVARHLRNFIILTGGLYLVLFLLLMIPVFFPVEHFAKQFYDAMNALVDNCYLYPSVSLAVLTEVFWLMNGAELKEEPVQVRETGRSLRRGRVVDLDRIEQDLMKTFGADNEVKCFYTDDVGAVDQSRSPVDISRDPVLESITAFVENQGLVRNDDYLRGIQALSDGKDTLFDAPLYTAAGMYLYPYLSMRISQGERVVVVCQDAGEIPAVIRNLENGFQRVLRTRDCLWQIADWKNYRPQNQTDVLVLTPEEFQDDRLFEDARDFFSQVTLAVLPDADRVVMSNNYFCLVMAERLRQNSGLGDVQYLFLSTRHTLNLAASLTEYFMLDRAVHTVQAEYAYGSLRLYVWKARNDGAAMLDNGAKTVQMEVGIAKVAQAGGVPSVNLVTGSAIFPDQVDPKWLDVYDASERPIGFAVVADDGFNLPSTIYAYSRYIGKQASVLHVICRPYLLRDYFFERSARSLYEQPLMERGVAEHAKMQRSSMILLVCRLMQGVRVETFAAEVHRLTDCPIPENLDFDALRELVERCLEQAFGSEAKKHSGFVVYQQMDGNFHWNRFIRIREEGILENLLADTELVTLRFNSGLGRPDVKLNLFRRMLDQRYLVGQNLVYEHHNYKVCRIDRGRGIIVVDDADVVHNVPDDYIQIRHYTLGDTQRFDQARWAIAESGAVEDEAHLMGTSLTFQGSGGIEKLQMVRSVDGLDIGSDTVAYYPIHGNTRSLDLTDATVVEMRVNEDRRRELHRQVGQSLYLKLEGDFARSDRLTMTFAVVLQEMMKTLFPDQYFCVSVCPILEDPEAVYNHADGHSRRIAGMYPRLRGWQQPAGGSIEVLIVDDCQGGTGVLDVLYSPEGTYLRNVLDMMSDYLQWQQGREESYLNFGADRTPALFDLDGLNKLMKVFSRRYVREHDLFRSLRMANCCDLCGRGLGHGESYLWDNRLNVCRDCREAEEITREECGLILQYAQSFLTDRFGISLPEGISVEIEKGKELSRLEVQDRRIVLTTELPLVNIHGEILMQLVRLWQMENLDMTGEPEFEGQVRYVLLQYLEKLEQYQRRRRIHRRSLLEDDPVSLGYIALRQALQTEGHDNSFQYMLHGFRKGVRPPQRPVKKKRSSRSDPWQVRKVFAEGLPEDLRRAYTLVFEGLMEMRKVIAFDGLVLTDKEVSKVMYAVRADNPAIFWVNMRLIEFAEGSTADHVTGIIPRYTMNGTERQRRQEELDEASAQFLEGITPDTGDYEAALTVYERLAEELDYDSLALEAQERRRGGVREDNTPDNLRTVYGALVLKKAVCAGYAGAFLYLMQQLGIECMYVRGNCSGEGRHGWNIVKLEGDYYHVDVTWGDNSNTDPSKGSEGFGYGYFCVTDRDILLSRTIDTDPQVPACTAVSCNYFVRSGLYFEVYDHRAVCGRMTELLADPGRRRLDIRFASAPVLEAAKRQLAYNGGMIEVLRGVGRQPQFSFSTEDKFHILTLFFPEGAQPEPAGQEDPQDEDPSIPGIDEPD